MAGKMWKYLLAFALALGTLSTGFAEPVLRGFYLDQNVQAAYNPLGVQLGTKLYYRMPLVRKPGILWESTKVDLGLANALSPAYDFFGGFVDIRPIAIFDLALTAQVAGYYSALGYGFHDLSGYDAAFDSGSLASLPSKNTAGYLLSASPTLQFALGPFAFADTLQLSYFDVDGGQGYFYETVANCALAKSGVELSNNVYLLYTLRPGIMLGLNDSLLSVPASGYRSQLLQAVGLATKRLSPRLSLYAALMAGLYLEDRYFQYAPHVAGEAGLTSAL
ncbi:MAG TPA: hypothetical protein VMV90_07740 [Rectinemataceae bacterium]|nr:hypothetical protein [Rectinemataceae bacterium]